MSRRLVKKYKPRVKKYKPLVKKYKPLVKTSRPLVTRRLLLLSVEHTNACRKRKQGPHGEDDIRLCRTDGFFPHFCFLVEVATESTSKCKMVDSAEN